MTTLTLLALSLAADEFAKAPRIHGVTTEDATGKHVSAYFNLHNKHWSLKDKGTGRVMGHTRHVVIQGARFHVGEAGRQRVIKEQQKNVHAFVRGHVEHVEAHEPPAHAVPVSYNPYKAGHFYRKDTGAAVHSADTVHMTPKGVFAVNPRGADVAKADSDRAHRHVLSHADVHDHDHHRHHGHDEDAHRARRHVLTSATVTEGHPKRKTHAHGHAVMRKADEPGSKYAGLYHPTASRFDQRLADHAAQQWGEGHDDPAHPHSIVRGAITHYKESSEETNALTRGFHPLKPEGKDTRTPEAFKRAAQATHLRIHVLDHALHRTHLPEGANLHRGLGGDLAKDLAVKHLRGTLVGSEIHDHAHASTTTDHTLAHSWSQQNDEPHPAVLHFHAPAGTLGAHIEGLHNVEKHRHEHEVLLPRGRRFHVVHAEHDEHGVLHVHAHLTNHDQPAPPLKLDSKYHALLGKNYHNPLHEGDDHVPSDPEEAARHAEHGIRERAAQDLEKKTAIWRPGGEHAESPNAPKRLAMIHRSHEDLLNATLKLNAEHVQRRKNTAALLNS